MSVRRFSRALLSLFLPRASHGNELNKHSIKNLKRKMQFKKLLTDVNHPTAEGWFWIIVTLIAILLGFLIGGVVSAKNPQIFTD